LTDRGPQVELIDQAPGATQPKTEARARTEAGPHSVFDIRNAGSVVGNRQHEAKSRTISCRLDDRLSPAAVGDGVPAKFTGGGHDLCLVEKTKTEADRLFPHTVAEQYDIFLGSQRNIYALKASDLRWDHGFPPSQGRFRH
jgi:hypothetical protein